VLVARDVEVSVADDVRILGPASLEVAPGSLVALMGASGSGKSTLLRVLAGIAEPTAGTAVWAGEPTRSAVQALGYVPQRESVHDRLTVREALSYAAALRLDAGVDIERRVERALDELGLAEQGNTLILRLSGGERRRAACGLELVGDPPVLLLDEPTSGLDTVLERRLMRLFRQLADHGRAVLVATHATASLDLCDEVTVLQEGLTVYRGSPAGAREHLAAVSGELQRSPRATDSSAAGSAVGAARAGHAPLSAARPFALELRVLTGRYLRTLTRDRRTLTLVLGQAPVIGVLIAIVFHSGALSAATNSPTNAVELMFMLMTGSIWLGVASACREVVKERGLVEREFDVGVRLDAYVVAKALVLFALNLVQVFLLTTVVVVLQPLGVAPGDVLSVFVLAVLTAWASAGMGLAVSCAARSVDQAAGAVPLLLMPQLLFAGALIPLAQMPGAVAWLANFTYARWSYAGLGSATQIGQRLSGDSSVLGFSNSFFSLKPGAAAVILIAFTLVELLVAIFFLMVRPPVDT
jgi:ABC-type multidrug transport system ATPase subunit/ABC-type multidrug transport system permease subunit